jgi:multicomponent Na+:H+ antiporter subunit D
MTGEATMMLPTPALLFIAAGLITPLVPQRVRWLVMIAAPLVGFWILLTTPYGNYSETELFGLTLTLFRFDSLSFIFGLIFHLAVFLSVIYSMHVRDTAQQAASMIYPGAAIGGLFAGDLVTLFVFWEIMAVASVFLIWASRTEQSYRAGLRYLIIHITSGVILLGGVILHYNDTQSIAFDQLGIVSAGTLMIFLAIGIKCAFPLLHNWLQDAYPHGTVTSTLVLSIFTTKLAVYALARAFPGTEQLIYIGATMTAFPVFFAVIENDLRKVLCYSLNNQVGFMVAAIGIGTPLALNGATGYAFVNIIFEGLLFMTMGAVLFRAGTTKASDLGALYKSMPYSATFCIIGALSISAFPFFSGFIAKGMILSEAAHGGHFWAWCVLLFASAGVLEHSGIKIPFFGFFGFHDSGIRVKEAPTHMLVAMAIPAVLTIAIGVHPELLYAILPYEADYAAYTYDHIITQLQLLVFAIFAFVFLVRQDLYPPEVRSINLDSDWFYRRLIPGLVERVTHQIRSIRLGGIMRWERRFEQFIATIYRHHGPQGALARSWPAGSTVLWVAILLCGMLIVFYVLDP